jgi:hypothetical protein
VVWRGVCWPAALASPLANTNGNIRRHGRLFLKGMSSPRAAVEAHGQSWRGQCVCESGVGSRTCEGVQRNPMALCSVSCRGYMVTSGVVQYSRLLIPLSWNGTVQPWIFDNISSILTPHTTFANTNGNIRRHSEIPIHYSITTAVLNLSTYARLNNAGTS